MAVFLRETSNLFEPANNNSFIQAMPFTTSHAVAVLPFKKLWPRWFSLSGLISGAMAPDLQYFLLVDTTYRGISHSWLGLFVVCLPMGLMFAFAFHWLFKRSFIDHLPHPLDQTMSGLAESKFMPCCVKSWLILIGSVLIGALSHFLWDSFTHAEGELARQIPWLLEKNTIFGVTRHNTRWVQHVSSILGSLGLVLGVWYMRLLPKPITGFVSKTTGQKLLFWLGGVVSGVAVACLATWFYNDYYNWRLELGHNRVMAFMSLGIGSWAGFFWYVCVYPLIRRSGR